MSDCCGSITVPPNTYAEHELPLVENARKWYDTEYYVIAHPYAYSLGPNPYNTPVYVVGLTDHSMHFDADTSEFVVEQLSLEGDWVEVERILIGNTPHSFSFTFDQNGYIAIVWESEGVIYRYWYDTFISDHTTTTVGAGKSPHINMESFNEILKPIRQIIMVYVNANNKLVYRLQDDRYTVEYVLYEDVHSVVAFEHTSRNSLKLVYLVHLPPLKYELRSIATERLGEWIGDNASGEVEFVIDALVLRPVVLVLGVEERPIGLTREISDVELGIIPSVAELSGIEERPIDFTRGISGVSLIMRDQVHRTHFEEPIPEGLTHTSEFISYSMPDVRVDNSQEEPIPPALVHTCGLISYSLNYTKAGLLNLINYANGLIAGDYTPASWPVLAGVVTAGQIVYDDPDATQQQIDDAASSIQAAINQLVPVPDKTALDDILQSIDNMDPNDYTPGSWSDLSDAVSDAQDVMDDPNADQSMVDAAVQAVQDAIDQLVPIVLPVDKSALLSVLNTASQLDEQDYTPESWSVLDGAVTSGQAVYDDADATQLEVDNAYAALDNAINQLVLINKSALLAAINAASQLNEADYTPTSWAVLAAAVTAGQFVYDDPEATQAEIDTAENSLVNAQNNLVLRADKTVLLAAINAAQSYSEEVYTPESWADLDAAVTAGQGVYDNADATQQQVGDAVQAILSVIADLVPVDIGCLVSLSTDVCYDLNVAPATVQGQKISGYTDSVTVNRFASTSSSYDTSGFSPTFPNPESGKRLIQIKIPNKDSTQIVCVALRANQFSTYPAQLYPPDQPWAGIICFGNDGTVTSGSHESVYDPNQTYGLAISSDGLTEILVGTEVVNTYQNNTGSCTILVQIGGVTPQAFGFGSVEIISDYTEMSFNLNDPAMSEYTDWCGNKPAPFSCAFSLNTSITEMFPGSKPFVISGPDSQTVSSVVTPDAGDMWAASNHPGAIHIDWPDDEARIFGIDGKSVVSTLNVWGTLKEQGVFVGLMDMTTQAEIGLRVSGYLDASDVISRWRRWTSPLVTGYVVNDDEWSAEQYEEITFIALAGDGAVWVTMNGEWKRFIDDSTSLPVFANTSGTFSIMVGGLVELGETNITGHFGVNVITVAASMGTLPEIPGITKLADLCGNPLDAPEPPFWQSFVMTAGVVVDEEGAIRGYYPLWEIGSIDREPYSHGDLLSIVVEAAESEEFFQATITGNFMGYTGMKVLVDSVEYELAFPPEYDGEVQHTRFEFAGPAPVFVEDEEYHIEFVPGEPTVVKSGLLSAILAAQAWLESQTPGDWPLLEAAVTAGQFVYDDEDATQQQVDDAEEAILTAWPEL